MGKRSIECSSERAHQRKKLQEIATFTSRKYFPSLGIKTFLSPKKHEKEETGFIFSSSLSLNLLFTFSLFFLLLSFLNLTNHINMTMHPDSPLIKHITCKFRASSYSNLQIQNIQSTELRFEFTYDFSGQNLQGQEKVSCFMVK